jgi:hypothetical protein
MAGHSCSSPLSMIWRRDAAGASRPTASGRDCPYRCFSHEQRVANGLALSPRRSRRPGSDGSRARCWRDPRLRSPLSGFLLVGLWALAQCRRLPFLASVKSPGDESPARAAVYTQYREERSRNLQLIAIRPSRLQVASPMDNSRHVFASHTEKRTTRLRPDGGKSCVIGPAGRRRLYPSWAAGASVASPADFRSSPSKLS